MHMHASLHLTRIVDMSRRIDHIPIRVLNYTTKTPPKIYYNHKKFVTEKKKHYRYEQKQKKTRAQRAADFTPISNTICNTLATAAPVRRQQLKNKTNVFIKCAVNI